ncbi:hypothetical protein Tco_1538030 [Tanacetum coccineum]
MSKLGDLTIDAYFRRLSTSLLFSPNLGSPMSSDDVVTYAHNDLSDKYDHVARINVHRGIFQISKTVRTNGDQQARYEPQVLKQTGAIEVDSQVMSSLMHLKDVHQQSSRMYVNNRVEYKDNYSLVAAFNSMENDPIEVANENQQQHGSSSHGSSQRINPTAKVTVLDPDAVIAAIHK